MGNSIPLGNGEEIEVVTPTEMYSAINDAVKSLASKQYVDSAMDGMRTSVPTKQEVATDIAAATKDFVTSEDMDAAIKKATSDYVTTEAMDTAITKATSGFVKSNQNVSFKNSVEFLGDTVFHKAPRFGQPKPEDALFTGSVYGGQPNFALHADGTLSWGDNSKPVSEHDVSMKRVSPATLGVSDASFIVQGVGGKVLQACGQNFELGFFGATPVKCPVVSGNAAGNTALISLIEALVSLGLIKSNVL